MKMESLDVRGRWKARMNAVEACTLPETVPDLLDSATNRYGERIALNFFEDDISVTYQTLRDLTCRVADGFTKMGITKGDRVAVMLSNRLEFAVSWIAIGRIGAIMVPINPNYTPRELLYVLNDSGALALVIEDSFLPTLTEIAGAASSLKDDKVVVAGKHENANGRLHWDDLLVKDQGCVETVQVARDDLLNIQYTSGTTGLPKGCMLSHDYWLVITRTSIAVDSEPAVRLLTAQPWFYMDPQWHLLKTLWSGGTLYCAKRPSLSRYISWLKKYKIEWCQFPKLAMQQPTEDDDGNTRLKHAFLSGWRGDAELHFESRFAATGRDIFGMTEIGMALAMPGDAVNMIGKGSCGLPTPWRKARICNASGEEALPGEVGELEISGRAILQGYWNKPEATAAAFNGVWFRTGDLFRCDDQGYYYIVGRIKEMIRRSSENISAREVESVVQMLPEVFDAAAVPVPDERRGEEVKLYIQLKPGLTPADCDVAKLQSHCERLLAPFKVPRYYSFIEEFPRTSSNKIAKSALTNAAVDPLKNAYDRVDSIWR